MEHESETLHKFQRKVPPPLTERQAKIVRKLRNGHYIEYYKGRSSHSISLMKGAPGPEFAPTFVETIDKPAWKKLVRLNLLNEGRAGEEGYTHYVLRADLPDKIAFIREVVDYV